MANIVLHFLIRVLSVAVTQDHGCYSLSLKLSLKCCFTRLSGSTGLRRHEKIFCTYNLAHPLEFAGNKKDETSVNEL
jgi:hypothetical protein